MFSSRSKAKPEDDRPGLGRSKAVLDRTSTMGMPSLFKSMPSMREGVAKMKYDTKGFLLRSKKSFKKSGFYTAKKKPKSGEEISGRTKVCLPTTCVEAVRLECRKERMHVTP